MNEQSSSHEELLQKLQRLQQRVAELEATEADRQKVEATLQAAVDGTAHTGEALFQWLVRYLCSTLDIQYAFVGELVGDAKDHIRTLAFWANGDLGENFQYELAGTPCEMVIGQQLQHYPCNLASLFPRDADIKALQVECYLGTPLFSAAGKPLGVLVAMDTEPEGTTRLEESALLRILASRAGAEIERQQAEAALRTSEERFRRAIVDAPIPIMIYTDDGTVLQISQQWTALTGYTLEDIPTLAAWTSRAYGEQNAAMQADIQQLSRAATSPTEKPRLRPRTGQRRRGASRPRSWRSCPTGDGSALARRVTSQRTRKPKPKSARGYANKPLWQSWDNAH